MKTDRIDIEQDILEEYQSATKTRQEDMFVMALEFLPADALTNMIERFKIVKDQ